MTRALPRPLPNALSRASSHAFGLALAALSLQAAACGAQPAEPHDDPAAERAPAQPGPREQLVENTAAPAPPEGWEVAVFAGGCFWCMESPFEHVEGVASVVSGYAGGHVVNPHYHDVGRGTTGHAEAIRVLFDPARVSYEALLEVFWHNVDPVDGGGQFCDRGSQYRSAIFPLSPAQRAAATASLASMRARFGERLATRIEDADTFYVAEDYHQDFYETNPTRYHSYRRGCGRDARLGAVWSE